MIPVRAFYAATATLCALSVVEVLTQASRAPPVRELMVIDHRQPRHREATTPTPVRVVDWARGNVAGFDPRLLGLTCADEIGVVRDDARQALDTGAPGLARVLRGAVPGAYVDVEVRADDGTTRRVLVLVHA